MRTEGEQPLIEGFDHVVVPVADLQAAGERLEQLGLTLTAPARHAGMGTVNRVFFCGTADSLFYVELIGIADAAEAAAHPRGAEIAAAVRRGGLLTLMLRARDLSAEVARFRGAGLGVRSRVVHRADGSLIGHVADLDVASEAGVAVSLIEYDEPQVERFARYASRGQLDHRLPILRLDSLTIACDSPASAANFWQHQGGAMPFLRSALRGSLQAGLGLGNAVLQLLPAAQRSQTAPVGAAASPELAFEVPDLAAAVAAAHEAGFRTTGSPIEPLDGGLLTRIAVSETGSIGLTLIQHLM